MRLERRGRRRASVSLTPLVDVVFLLLMFFVLAGRFDTMQEIGFDVAGPAEAAPGDESPVVMVRLAVDGARLPGRALDLGAWLAQPDVAPARTVVLFSIAEGVPLQHLVDWLDRFRAAGFSRFAYLG